MMPEAQIDVFDADGHLIRSFVPQRWPVTIGRGFDNDIIVDDPFMAANHAALLPDESGAIWARDLGTRNRLKTSRRAASVDAIRIDQPAEFLVGRTRLRVRSSRHPLAAERLDQREPWPTRPLFALALVAASMALVALGAWAGTPSQAKSVWPLLAPPVIAAGALVAWASMWTLVGRLVGKRIEFMAHLGIGASALIIADVASSAAGLLGFATATPALTRFGYVGFGVIIGVAIYAHLAHANPARRRGFQLAGAAAAVMFIGLMGLLAYDRVGRLSSELYSTNLYPPQLRLARSGTLEEFFARSETLARLVDGERKKSGGSGSDDDPSND